jgi:hypothetical protein
MSAPWTAERDAELIRLRHEGAPYSEIGRTLGVGRNAAIGRACGIVPPTPSARHGAWLRATFGRPWRVPSPSRLWAVRLASAPGRWAGRGLTSWPAGSLSARAPATAPRITGWRGYR